MKLLLISDSHGSAKAIDKIFKDCQFDYLFFMGDGISDLGLYINLENVYAVSGNCDLFSSMENEKVVELEGKKFLITHGNKYGVKSNLNKLIERAEDLKVDFVFYGHTHKSKYEKFGQIYYINPGSFHKNGLNEHRGYEIVIDEDMEINDLIIQ